MSDLQPLPDGWKWVRLGQHVTKIGSGVTPRGGHAAYKSQGIPLIRSQNVHMRHFEYEGLAFISSEQDESMASSRVQKGDVLLNITGASIGRICVVPDEVCPANVNQHVSIIRTDGSVSPNYLAFYISSSEFQKYINHSEAGATRQALTKALIENFQIPLPPLTEQQRIAAILAEQMADIESARRAAEAQLEAAESLTAAYLRSVFDSNEAQEWETVSLGKLAKTGSGSTPSRNKPQYYENGSIPWVKTGELRDSIIYETDEYVTDLAIQETSLKLLPKDTLLIAMYGQGQTRGRTGILALPSTTNQACFAIMPNPQVFSPLYLQWWFRYSYLRLRNQTEGRGGNQPNLSGEVLKQEQIPLPPKMLQERIVADLGDRANEIEFLRVAIGKRLDAVDLMPAAVLRQAFSGNS